MKEERNDDDRLIPEREEDNSPFLHGDNLGWSDSVDLRFNGNPPLTNKEVLADLIRFLRELEEVCKEQ